MTDRIPEEIRDASAEELLHWAFTEFGDGIAIASSFGAEDMVLLDIASKVAERPRVFTLDTGRLPEETYALVDRARERYGIGIEVYFPDTSAVEEMERSFGVNLFYRSIEDRKRCCDVRKMEPLRRAMAGLDGWVCGLRREQAVTRAEVAKIEIDGGNGGILKFNPLADWTLDELWGYIRENDVPYNALHDKGYPSIGCAPCTRAVAEGEDIRAGRWWWEAPEHKECGLHAKRAS
ncbi:MAG TPA: phosphoadenylyl-sulfate reductase [Coriobacteriia bacterium]|jgi:phosphoadenosine phosphosulfate reductase